LRMPCCTDSGNALTSTFSPSASASFGLRPGPMPPCAAPSIVLSRCRVPPQNDWSPNVSKRKVCLPWRTSAEPALFAWRWPAALLPGRVLALGALATAALNARAVPHLLRPFRVNVDRHQGVLRPPVSVLERDEGAMPLPASFYRLKLLSIEACSGEREDVNARAVGQLSLRADAQTRCSQRHGKRRRT